jgi:hypothetical protein
MIATNPHHRHIIMPPSGETPGGSTRPIWALPLDSTFRIAA